MADEAFMIAPTVMVVVLWMVWLVWMLASVGLVLSASRLTVQGGGVLAWAGRVVSVVVAIRRIARRADESVSLLWRLIGGVVVESLSLWVIFPSPGWMGLG